MLKLLLLLCLSLCLSSVQAALNLSTKPKVLNVYVEQNFPYSGVNSRQEAQGLLVDYWQLWSQHSAISVHYYLYAKEPLPSLLNTNKPSVYIGLQGDVRQLSNLKKTPLFALNSTLYYLTQHSAAIDASFSDKNLPLVVGGLFPKAQQITGLTTTATIIYKQYPDLLGLLVELYSGELDALVLLTGAQQKPRFLERVVSLLLAKRRINTDSTELFAYTSKEQDVILDWIAWGNQQAEMPSKMALLLEKNANPVWGSTSGIVSTMTVFFGFILVFVIASRLKRTKDREFKDILDSSPYPLVIFSLDGNTLYYLNDEVKSLISFKSKKNESSFEEAENQLILSRFVNKASHQTIIEATRLHLLVGNSFHDIEISAKRIHYKRKTAWFCHLKDVTDLLRAERKFTQERELLRKVLDSIPQQIAIKSPKGTIIGCNTSWAGAHNTTVLYATGRRIADILPIDIINQQKQQEIPVWAGDTLNKQEWLEQKHNNQLSLINTVKLPLYNDQGTIFAILSIDSDITHLYNLNEKLKGENLQRQKTEKVLSKQNILLRTLFSASMDAIGLVDHEGRVTGANKAFAKLMNSDVDEIVGQLQSELLHSDSADWAERQNAEVLASGQPLVFEYMMFSDPKKVCYEIQKTPFKDPESDYQGIVIMARDISLRKQTEEKLGADVSDVEENMLHDPLTRIANRRAFERQFSQIWQEALDEQELLSLVLCDIDFFKPYNDNYGHQKGEQALQGVAQALQSACDPLGCFVARYGAEEFVILMKGGNATKALSVAEEIRQSIKKAKMEHLYSSVNRIITLSMGLSSIFPSELNSMAMLQAEADSALSAAKDAGRDQVSVH